MTLPAKLNRKVDAMINRDKMPYLLLFCVLLIIQKRGARMDSILASVPLTGNARNLAREIAYQELITDFLK